MAVRVTWRQTATAFAIAAAASLATQAPPLSHLGDLSIDALFWARQEFASPPSRPAASTVAIIAVDEETYRRVPFSEIPSALWTAEMARVLNAVLRSGPKVVGLDLVYPISGERVSAGFDRPFLEVLQNAGPRGQLVLAKVQHSSGPIAPHAAQRIAVGGEKNIRAINLMADSDDIVRRSPLMFESEDGKPEPSFALELASRALGKETGLRSGYITLGKNKVAKPSRPTILLNFEARGARPKVYSLADLAACAVQGRNGYFEENFAGKVVVVGAVLDVEDRKLTSFRFATGAAEVNPGPRCAFAATLISSQRGVRRDTIPGVIVLATAIDNLIQGTALSELSTFEQVALIVAFALFASIGGVVFPLRLAVLGWLILLGGALTASVLLFRGSHVVLPVLPVISAIGLSALLSSAFRYTSSEREKSRVRRSFELFLPPAVLVRMLSKGKLPTLGGEEREITVLFADIVGFTGRSEKLAPTELVRLLNAYFQMISEEVEQRGGIIDKFMGDAVMAVFGAPTELENHAKSAVLTAVACRQRLAEFNVAESLRDEPIHQHIGINTGRAVIGNFGSRRRLNYTAIGDVVNVAQRLQEANAAYNTDILVSEATKSMAGDAVVWREIATANLRGRTEPIRLFEPSRSQGSAMIGLVEQS